MAEALHGPQFDGKVAGVFGGGDIRGGVGVARRLATIGQGKVLGGGWGGQHTAAGALGVQSGDAALIRRVRVGGAVEKQQRRGPVAVRVTGCVVLASPRVEAKMQARVRLKGASKSRRSTICPPCLLYTSDAADE